MKAQYQIVGDQQFEYIMVEKEVESHEEAVEAYKALKGAFIGPKQPQEQEIPSGVGLDDKEWRTIVDGYRTLGTMPSDAHERMSKQQQWFIKQLDLSDSRINYKNGN